VYSNLLFAVLIMLWITLCSCC